MLEDVRYSANNNISADDARIKSSDFAQKSPSFRATNPNAVDTTPTADTYSPTGQELPPEMSFGEKFVRYMFPTWMGLHYGTKLFNHLNGGEYEKSLVGRLGKWGDQLSQSSIIKNSFMDSVKSKFASLKTKGQAFIDRHETLSAMQKTPTKPTCPLVTNFLETQSEADLKEAGTKIKDFADKNPKTLKLAGATTEEIEALKTKFGKGAFGRIKNEQQAVEEFLIGKIGKDVGKPDILTRVESVESHIANKLSQLQNEYTNGNLTAEQKLIKKQEINKLKNLQSTYRSRVLSSLKIKAMGLNKSTLNMLAKEPEIYAGNIERALESSSKYSTKMTEYLNKVKSISTPQTKLGRFLPKAAKLGMRGLTFGGGLFNSLFVAFFLGDAVKNTIDAPKDQKASTAAHGLFEAMSWVIAMPLALKGMHAVNGLKNLGKTEAQVKAYEAKYEAFKAKANAGGFASKAEYDAAWENVKALKNVGTKPKGFKWVLSKLASFTSIGLEQKPAYKEATVPFGLKTMKSWFSSENLKKVGGNLKRLSKNMPKNWVGYPLRFALYMFAFQPVVDKLFSAPLTAIFGKPYEPEKIAEEQEKAKQEAEMEELRKRFLYPGPSISPNPEAVNGLNNLDMNNISDDNLVKQELIKRGLANPNQKFNTIPQDSNNGYMNSANGVQIDIRNSDKPFMPADTRSSNSVNMNNNSVTKDPSKSDYDTVPRSFVPEINRENPVPYSDPFTNPNYERNYDKMRESIEKSEKFIAETEKWIDNNFED